MEKKESEFKKKAFGEVTEMPLEKNHDFKPDKEKLKAPLSEGAGVRSFCTYCGRYHEMTAHSLEELTSIFDIEVSPDKHYLETTLCYLCDSERIGMVVKNIEDGTISQELRQRSK
ncbi:MAG: hypothetical protein WCR71_04830 [Bacteroidales bacterium]